MNEPNVAEGHATISPDTPVNVGESGVWTMTYIVGESGLAPGDTLRMTIPSGFSAPQIDSADTPGYVTIESGNLGAVFRVAVEPIPGQIDIDLREEAGAQAVYLILERGPLRSGETVKVTYGAGEGKAYASPYAGTAAFSVWVSRRVEDEVVYAPVPSAPALDVRPGEIAVLDAIHLLVEIEAHYRRTGSRGEAIRASVDELWTPMLFINQKDS